jgi:aspartate 4-decarboxylase
MTAMNLNNSERLSPLELNDVLVQRARASAEKSPLWFLNSGRGNPNWLATTARDGFFLLGQFAMTESRRVLDLPAGIGGNPAAPGIAARLQGWLAGHSETPGAAFLAQMVPWAVANFRFDADAFVHELVDSVLGDSYPLPDRILKHNEIVAREYLQWAMCGEPRPEGTFNLCAVEGGTAAMCYIFRSLKHNELLKPGDTIALSVPNFTPYLEMPLLDEYGLDIVNIHSLQQGCASTGDDLGKLLDPRVKAMLVVNPGNPSAMAMSDGALERLGAVLKERPDLIILTDDVYGTFVPGFRSLLGAFPRNTIGVYSYSKYFGCTGWRLGVIAIHENNICDPLIAWNTTEALERIDHRYETITLDPRQLAFIDRIVADSREVALYQSAGLSLPQQAMMLLFSLGELMDEDKEYQRACSGIVRKRVQATIEGLGLDIPDNSLCDYCHGLIDIEYWMRNYAGDPVADWVIANVDPLDPVFRLADEFGIFLPNGGGLAAPDWSVRVSFASLADHIYDDIGRAVRSISRRYRESYEASLKAPAG